MYLQIMSDLHLEFSLIEIENAGADVLVLAGDIFVADYFTRGEASPHFKRATEVLAWFEDVCSKFDNVIYIMGNHEHYYGTFQNTAALLRSKLDHCTNLHFLDKNYIRIDDVTFVGGTLWGDFDGNPVKMEAVKGGLNDYHCVKGAGYRKLSPYETVRDHVRMKNAIVDAVRMFDKVVVIGHHAPSYQSVRPQYAQGRWRHLNPGYASSLDQFIIDQSAAIPLWIHGHMHDGSDYMIEQTRVICNPRGYQKANLPAENRNFNPNLVVEI